MISITRMKNIAPQMIHTTANLQLLTEALGQAAEIVGRASEHVTTTATKMLLKIDTSRLRVRTNQLHMHKKMHRSPAVLLVAVS